VLTWNKSGPASVVSGDEDYALDTAKVWKMAFTPRSDEEAAKAITRLVDGTLSDRERPEVEAWASATPDVIRTVALQRQVKHGLAAGGPATPQALLDRVADRLDPSKPVSERRRAIGTARPSTRPGSLGRPSSRWRPAISLGAVAAVAAIVIAVVVVMSGATTPSITTAARLAFVKANEPAPGVSNAHYLDVSYHGVTFPNYKRLNAVATGQLRNRIDGRSALTVFYRLRGGQRLSYTVFSGRPVTVPTAARQTRFQGVPLRVYQTSDGLSVVTLVRHGRTCVLAAPTSKRTVLALAAEPVLVSANSPA